jgi:hypothetical protein
MKLYDNRTIRPSIAAAIHAATNLFDYQSGMMQELAEKDDFKFNSGLGYEIVNKIRAFDKAVPVFTYRPWNPFTAALGYSKKGKVYINVRKLDSMEFSDLVGLMVHERLHAIGFNHGTGMYSNYKTEEACLYSVPYYCSENILKWL